MNRWTRGGEGCGEPADWAEFVTLALAGAAANSGTSKPSLLVGRASGRPRASHSRSVRPSAMTISCFGTAPSRSSSMSTSTRSWSSWVRDRVRPGGRGAQPSRQALTETMSEPPTPEQERSPTRSATCTTGSRSSACPTGRAAGRRCEPTPRRSQPGPGWRSGNGARRHRHVPPVRRGWRSGRVRRVGDDWVEEAVLATPLPGKAAGPLSGLGRCERLDVERWTGLRSSSAQASHDRGRRRVARVRFRGLHDVLAAKLTANGPGSGWTPVDVGGRGGGAIRGDLSVRECHGMEEVRGSNPLSSTVKGLVSGSFGNRTQLLIKVLEGPGSLTDSQRDRLWLPVRPRFCFWAALRSILVERLP